MNSTSLNSINDCVVDILQAYKIQQLDPLGGLKAAPRPPPREVAPLLTLGVNKQTHIYYISTNSLKSLTTPYLITKQKTPIL